MKKAYFSPELEKSLFVDEEVLVASQHGLGSGDWGVQDDFV